MPMRDHFRPPLSRRTTWEGVHAGWPMVLVQHLSRILPAQFVAEPGVHRGALAEIDVATFEADPGDFTHAVGVEEPGGAAWAPAEPSVAVETELLDSDEFAVRVFDVEFGRRLVAAVEIVSPANKDRPEQRGAFVGKCEALLRKGVSVSIVDLVTVRHFNLYAELLELVGKADPTLGAEPPATSAAACRWVPRGRKRVLETWSHVLRPGELLPTLPLWLTETYCVPLDLEASYEETCRVLRIA